MTDFFRICIGLTLAAAMPWAQASWWQNAPPPAAPLTVDEAFEMYPPEYRDGQLQLSWRIAPDHYLYRFRLKVIALPSGEEIRPQWPAGLPYHDEHFGDVEIYRELLTGTATISGEPPQRIRVTYQGCADAGLCYPPKTQDIEVDRL